MVENKMLVDDCWQHIESASGIENMVQQPEHGGIDVFGSELFEGDEIAIDQDNFDEIIWKENLKRYCVEVMNFTFDRGWVIVNNSLLCRERWLESVLVEDYNFKFTQAD